MSNGEGGCANANANVFTDPAIESIAFRPITINDDFVYVSQVQVHEGRPLTLQTQVIEDGDKEALKFIIFLDNQNNKGILCVNKNDMLTAAVHNFVQTPVKKRLRHFPVVIGPVLKEFCERIKINFGVVLALLYRTFRVIIMADDGVTVGNKRSLEALEEGSLQMAERDEEEAGSSTHIMTSDMSLGTSGVPPPPYPAGSQP